MNNYFGIGLDAKISLEFNNKRDEHPKKCRLAETPLGIIWDAWVWVLPCPALWCPCWEGLLGWITGMLERNMGMPGKTTGMPGWIKGLLKGIIRMPGGTTGLLEETTGMPG